MLNRVKSLQVAVLSIGNQAEPWFRRLSRPVLGLMLILLSSAFILHALHVLRRPGWQSRGWWANHQLLAALLGGRGRLATVGAWFELIGAAVLLAAGVALVIFG